MCKKLKRKGEFFIKISNLGTTNLSYGYDCIHAKTIEILFGKLVKTFVDKFFDEKSENRARAYLAVLLLKSFIDDNKALELGNKILTEIGSSSEIWRGQKSVLVSNQD